MPGMNLGFVRNATQRIAAHKHIPAAQLEALIAHGAPEKRAAAVKKVIEAAPGLCQHRETYQLILTVCDATDSTKRCEMLYAMRRKLPEMCRNRFGNVVLQKLIEKLPAVQAREIAVDLKEEAADLARHPFGNRVLQQLATQEAAADEVVEALLPSAAALAVHATGQHALAAFVKQGFAPIVDAVTAVDVLGAMLALPESAVLTALVGAPRLADEVQQQVRGMLLQALPKLVEEGRQHFALTAAIDAATVDEIAPWHAAILPLAATMAKTKGLAAVVAAIIRRLQGKQREQLVVAALKAFDTPVDAAKDPHGSLVVREALTAGAVSLPAKGIAALVAAAEELMTDASGVGVAQRLLTIQAPGTAKLEEAVAARAVELASHQSGTHVLQSFLDTTANEALKEQAAAAVLAETMALCLDQQGTFAVQKALAVASRDTVANACDILLTSIGSLAFDSKANFCVAAALAQAKNHDLPQKKTMMDALKPRVTDLATRPWVGTVVLDAMFAVGSTELKAAIRNVIFLKCEAYLSEGPRDAAADGAASGGADRRRPRSAKPAAGRGKRHTTEKRE